MPDGQNSSSFQAFILEMDIIQSISTGQSLHFDGLMVLEGISDRTGNCETVSFSRDNLKIH